MYGRSVRSFNVAACGRHRRDAKTNYIDHNGGLVIAGGDELTSGQLQIVPVRWSAVYGPCVYRWQRIQELPTVSSPALSAVPMSGLCSGPMCCKSSSLAQDCRPILQQLRCDKTDIELHHERLFSDKISWRSYNSTHR